MIRKTLLSLTLVGVILLPDIGSAQYAGNYDLTGVHNVYNYIVREMSNSLDDSLYGGYSVTAYWPSQASALFAWPLLTYDVGDTVLVTVSLPLPIYLSALGIGLNSDIYDDGTLIINGTYPSIQTSNCSTAITVPAITDNATYSSAGDQLFTSDLTTEQGWGITTSGVFATNMYPPDLNTEVYGTDYGVGTEQVNWGKFTAHYSDSTLAFVQTAEIYWEQIDANSTGAGVDSEGELNGSIGVVAAFGDSSTVPALAAGYNGQVNGIGDTISINVGTYPIIGGSGVDLDGDGEPDGVIPSPDPTAGEPGLEWGYLFDPSGDDGVLFSGDEATQWTGYYMTGNFLTGFGALVNSFGQFSDPEYLIDTDGDGIPDTHQMVIDFMQQGQTQVEALGNTVEAIATAAMTQLAIDFGLPAATAAVLGASVGLSAETTLVALLTAGTDPVAAITQTAQATGAVALGTLAAAGIELDDSDHDFNGTNGRLVFQVGNNCIPRNQHLSVNSFWVNTGTAEIDSDESLIPKEFALYDNYPNPFNPTTQIAVDLPEAATTEITVWNIMGQRVATLYSGDLNAGHHTLNFDGRASDGKQLTSGMYIYRVAAGKYNATKKMTLMK